MKTKNELIFIISFKKNKLTSTLNVHPSKLSNLNEPQLAKAREAIAVAPSSSTNRVDAKLIICKLIDSPTPSNVGKTSLIREDPSSLMECNWVETRTVSPKHIESSSDNCALLKSSPCNRE